MLPHLTILILAIIGLFVHGLIGFFVWGGLGYMGVLAVGWLLRRTSGGLLPRHLREETAMDFVSQYPEFSEKAFQCSSAYQASQKVSQLLESFSKRALRNNPSANLNTAYRSEVFLPSAREVAAEQSNPDVRELADQLCSFIEKHPLWYKSQ